MVTRFKGKKVAVIGAGMEGKDAVKFLLKQGARVSLFDKKSQRDLNLEGLDISKVDLICGRRYLSRSLANFDLIIRSPGVYPNIVQLIKARKLGVGVSSVTKIFFELSPATIIGVTGTKGKGTTSTLIYRILKGSGRSVFLAGNIGRPCLELLPKLRKQDLVVLELSSFQLIDFERSPHIAVVLNITEDHMDWHRDRGEYVKSKARIVKYQGKSDFAVLNADYTTPRDFARYSKAEIFYFSKRKEVKGCYVEDGKIFLEVGDRKLEVGRVADLQLRGEHNWENVTAAICASYLAKTDIPAIKKAVFSFRGLEHRLELVGKVRGIAFYNDSFATNPQPTIAAIKSFREPITLILGGSDKNLNYIKMAKVISGRKNVRTVVLIGEIAEKIKRSLGQSGFKGRLINHGKSPMAEIVRTCFRETPRDGVVLLSPASASFDMFKDYKDRGNQFKEAVNTLRENG